MNSQSVASLDHADAFPEEAFPEEFLPDIDDLVTEDDTPVDNIFSEKQQRLLTESLYSSWPHRPFVALANVGLFYRVHHTPLVPDMLISLGVEIPEDVWTKSHRAYFVWEFGKPPDAVVEVVSNKKGHELDSKIVDYAMIGVKYYVVFDPEKLLSGRLLRLYELHGGSYVERTGSWMPDMGLGLRLWEGAYEGLPAQWLRWCDQQGKLIETGTERADKERQQAQQERQRADKEHQQAQQERQRADKEHQQAQQERQRADKEHQQAQQERQRADKERQRADKERQRAEQEALRAERMARRLKELGIDPDELSG